jgi:hypothetical protein
MGVLSLLPVHDGKSRLEERAIVSAFGSPSFSWDQSRVAGAQHEQRRNIVV